MILRHSNNLFGIRHENFQQILIFFNHFTELDEEKKSDDSKFYLIVEMGQNREMNREYLIYDVWSLIGTVGGALGLFVGFSFYDFISLVIDFIAKRCERVHPEAHHRKDLEKGDENLPDISLEQYRNELIKNDIIRRSYRKSTEISSERLEEILSSPFNAKKHMPGFNPYLHSVSRNFSLDLDPL